MHSWCMHYIRWSGILFARLGPSAGRPAVGNSWPPAIRNHSTEFDVDGQRTKLLRSSGTVRMNWARLVFLSFETLKRKK